MKAFFVLLAAGTVMLAQTPPPAKSAAPASKAPAVNPLMHPETLKARAPDSFRVKFTTTHGDFVVAVHRDWAPLGADRFYNMVRSHYFTNVAFFRFVPGFIVQFGKAPDPKVEAVWTDASIKDDPRKATVHNTKGTLVFANAGANSRSNQLFVNLGDNSSNLDNQVGFTPFGEVTEGMDIVQGLYSGYGEQPDQGSITREGKAYLDRHFPKLDYVKSAVLLPAEGAPAAKSTAPAKAMPPAVKK
jgi:peptidyl-prolyl cis-trans isomerase A (cyclophilin A)